MLTNELAAGAAALLAAAPIDADRAAGRIGTGLWRRRAIKLEPWLLGLAGFLLTSAGLLHNGEGSAGERLPAMAVHISGVGAS